MRDTTTLVGPFEAALPRPSARRVTLTPLKRLSRAHLALAERRAITDEAHAALEAATKAVSSELGHPLTATTRLLDSTLQPLQHLARESLFVIVELSAIGATALLELEAPFVAHLLRVAAGSEARTLAVTELTRIESAALGWLGLAAVAGLRSVESFEARYAPRLVTWTMDRGEALRSVDAAVRHLAIELRFSNEHPLGGARVLVPAKLLQTAIQSAPRSEPGPALAAVLDATVDATWRFGHAELARAHLSELTIGDVIVFAGCRLAETQLHGPARLLTRSIELSGELGADGFTVTRAVPLTPESSMASTLNVDVEIELTTIQVPLRQLGAIAPGAVLPLHINAAQSVTLRIDGKAVALAELVEVEGEIGARITAMLEGAP